MNKQGDYARFRRGRFLAAILVLVLIAAVGACSSARLKQFQDFSTAGQDYTKMMVKLIEETKVMVVDTDSTRLIANRIRKAETRLEILKDRTEALKRLLTQLDEIQKQTVLLGHYFKALAKLAESEAPKKVGEDLDKTFKQLEDAGGEVAKFELTDKPISSYVVIPIKFVLEQFQVAALEKAMKAKSGTIARLLSLQEQTAKALEDLLKEETDRLREARELRLRRQFREGKGLGDEWISLRRRLLLPEDVICGGRVSAAAHELGEAYAKLAEGRFEHHEFNDLMGEIGNIADVVKELKGEDDDGQ